MTATIGVEACDDRQAATIRAVAARIERLPFFAMASKPTFSSAPRHS